MVENGPFPTLADRHEFVMRFGWLVCWHATGKGLANAGGWSFGRPDHQRSDGEFQVSLRYWSAASEDQRSTVLP